LFVEGPNEIKIKQMSMLQTSISTEYLQNYFKIKVNFQQE